MRDIKFRAWDIHRSQWVYFTLEDAIYGCSYNKDRERYAITDASNLINEGQYTGLKDKNGVDIYEGDKVTLGSAFTYVVEWIPSGQFKLKSNNTIDGRGYTLTHAIKYGEVIGNIHENKELLK